jgi:hypothetical protein
MTSFRTVFIAVVLAFALIVGAFLVNRARPSAESKQPNAALGPGYGKVRGMPLPAAVQYCPRIRDERSCAKERQLSRLPPASPQPEG